MKNLVKLYNNIIIEDNESVYLSFDIGYSKYAINIAHVVEIMKLPLLDYPQKLANNIVGLLNYNNFTINILDLRFYLNIKVTPYSVSNQLLIVKTDETMFGLIIDKVDDIVSFDQSKLEYFPSNTEERIIEFLYKNENETVSVVNLSAVESILKTGAAPSDIDIPSLFPQDDDSRYKFNQRNQALARKFELDLAINIFSQDKFITFALDNNVYCINLEYIREFLKNFPMTRIPCAVDYIAGIISLRGDFVSIIDLKKFFGLNDSQGDYENKESKNNIIILETSDFKIGFLVDDIFGIVEIPEDLVNENSYNQPHKHILSEVFLEEKLYSILNVKNILSDERFFIKEG